MFLNGYNRHEPTSDVGDAWEPTNNDGPMAPPVSQPVAKPTTVGRLPVKSVLDDRWLRLVDAPHFLADKPPPQDWLLTQFVDGRDVGVLPRGRAGLFTSAGGVGKTVSMCQLALAVGLGEFWYQFKAAKGHVLLALGEEEMAEVHRRLWRACNALELPPEVRRELAERIDILPLAGLPIALTASAGGTDITTTQLYADLRQRLEERGVDWALIIFDPLSRWAGGGVEKDNETATRFVQAIEALCSVRGNPTVLVVHHSSKGSQMAGESDARGVSGIQDGFRWRATFDVLKKDGKRVVKLRNPKNNYAPEFEDVYLVRSDEPGQEGMLRVAHDSEVSAFDVPDREQRQQAAASAKCNRAEQDARALVRLLKDNPGIGKRDVRSLAAAKLGIGSDRVDAGLAFLGDAVVRTPGTRGAVHLAIDPSAIPVTLEPGET